MWVKATSEKASVWDREQGDEERGLTVPTDGTPIEVEATPIIMAAVRDGRLVECKEPAADAAPADQDPKGGKGKDKDKT